MAIELQLREAGLPLYIKDGGGHFHHHGGRGGPATLGTGGKWILNEAALEKFQQENAEKEAAAEREKAMKESNQDSETIDIRPTSETGTGVSTSGEMEKSPVQSRETGAPPQTHVLLNEFETLRESEFQEESYGEFRKRIKKEEQREFLTKAS